MGSLKTLAIAAVLFVFLGGFLAAISPETGTAITAVFVLLALVLVLVYRETMNKQQQMRQQPSRNQQIPQRQIKNQRVTNQQFRDWQRQHQGQLEWLHEHFTTNPQPKPSTPKCTIPSDVKRRVWRRDCGRCVGCGSNENLEYDHVIPVSKGGSNTERNVQLLCEHCNRKKHAKIM